ncbi:MAG: O-acetyl-ADP-ribose deacetylase [Acidobacteriaceae bacterium]
MIVRVVQGDITSRDVDAIVNAANGTLLGGGGVDGAIHRAAGPELLAACRTLGGCSTGGAKITPAFGIRQARWIVHAVGPIYGRNPAEEARLLASCYADSLRLAVEAGARSVAFPSISTGAYGYPVEEAGRVALGAVRTFAEKPEAPDLVEMVTFSAGDFRAYQRAYEEIFGAR